MHTFFTGPYAQVSFGVFHIYVQQPHEGTVISLALQMRVRELGDLAAIAKLLSGRQDVNVGGLAP